MSSSNKRIIWLASYPKSGNTWFRVFLNNLLSGTEAPANINQLDSSMSASDRIAFDQYLGINSSDLTFSEIDRYRPEVYRRIATDSDGYSFIKTHDIWRTNDNQDPIFPEDVTKGVLYFIRNPLDVVVSFAHHGNISISRSIHNLNNSEFGLCVKQSKLYNQIHQELGDWSNHVISWTKSSGLPVHVTRYEDIISNPTDEFTKCLDFIGLEYTQSKVELAASHSTFEKLQQQELKFGFREKELVSRSFFRKGAVNDWLTKLNQAQVNNLFINHGTKMREFGYLEEIKSENYQVKDIS